MGVFIARLADGVGQICQQGEVQIGITIGQEANFKVIDELVYLVLIQQQGGIATNVVQSAGIASLKSNLGRGCGS